MAKPRILRPRYLGTVIDLAEGVGKPRFKIQALKAGKYAHPQAPDGVLDLSEARLKAIYDNFYARARGKELPVDEGHEDKLKRRSKAWIDKMELVDGGTKLNVEGWVANDELFKALKSGEVRYFSPELLLNWRDTGDGKTKDVMKAGSFTNMPCIKDMDPAQIINLAEAAEEDPELAQATKPDPNADQGTGDQPGKAPGQGGIGSGGSRLADAEDQDAEEPDLPQQCASCALLMDGSCPFQGIDVKIAAAGDGLCPKYTSLQVTQNPSDDDGGEGGNTTEMDEKAVNALIEAQVAPLQVNLAEAISKLAEKDVIIASLSGQVVNLAEVNQAKQDEAFVALDNITPAQATLAKQILLADRSSDGTIELSEDNGKTTVKKSVQVLLGELLQTIEPVVELADNPNITRVPRKNAAGEDEAQINLDEAVWVAAREIAQRRGGNPADFYGEALRAQASSARIRRAA